MNATAAPNAAHYPSNLMSRIVSNAVLEAAFAAVVKSRELDSHNSDIWWLRRHWGKQKEVLRECLLIDTYQLSPLMVLGSREGPRLTRWTAIDTVVLKAITLVLTEAIQPKSDSRCHHLKGNGGLKRGVNRVHDAIEPSRFHYAVKSDIADFYASMDHEVLLAQCRKIIKDERIIKIIQQYMNRVEVNNGDHNLIETGIAKGCPLSPLMGALMLKSLDKMVPPECADARYRDDWIIFTKTRWQLRRVIKNMHELVRGLKLKLALDKTFIGRIQKGFDFLGYQFNVFGLCGLAQKTIDNHCNQRLRLDEQGAPDQRVQAYIASWKRWVRAGITLPAFGAA
jgi:hypothetical protein